MVEDDTVVLLLLRNNRCDKRVPFPHVHNIEIVLQNIPMPDTIKLRFWDDIEIDLAKSSMIELITVKITCDHQLIHDVRCNIFEICRINNATTDGWLFGLEVVNDDDDDDDVQSSDWMDDRNRVLVESRNGRRVFLQYCMGDTDDTDDDNRCE